MKNVILVLLILLSGLLVHAQEEEEAEAIPYLQLGHNFAVPDLPAWEHLVEGETALFSNAALNAQIYVAAFDLQEIDRAITEAISAVYPNELGAAIYSSRIGRNDGTWEYRLFSAADTSITAYGMLKSNRVYVVLFIENSADYTAYHLAIRSNIANAEGQAVRESLDAAALLAIQQSLNPDFAGTVQTASNPNPDNPAWVLAEYEDQLATASYINNNIVYVTVVEGAASIAPELSNAFDTVFLGFVITPNNSEYLYLGLAFSGSILLILIGSIWLRYRNLQNDLKTIEQLAEN